MSIRAARWCLFAALALTLPLPFLLAAPERAPLVRLVFLAGLMLAIVLADGVAGTAALFAVFLGVQGLAYVGVLYGAAWLVARALAGRSARSRAAWVGAAAAGLLGLSLLEIYRTPHSSRGPTANLTGIFE